MRKFELIVGLVAMIEHNGAPIELIEFEKRKK